MDSLERLKLLSQQMDLEPVEDAACPKVTNPGKAPFISQAVLPNGKRISLLKTLLTSACERNCYYCPFRAGRDYRRATFKPDELAQTFMMLHQAGIAQGIFLSSGIIGGGVRTQSLLIDSAEILRKKLGYTGYMHLKIMPGAEFDQLRRAMQFADRVSINLEAPNTHRLGMLAPSKRYLDELLEPLQWIEQIRKESAPDNRWRTGWPSSTTQFVVGAVGESDLELLSTTQKLYQSYGLQRAYFSAFNPVPDTPLENLPAESAIRQHRLYQASFLMRDYQFDIEDLPLDSTGNLPRHIDPKLSWAQTNLSENPVEINRADRRQLMQIPGIGPKGASRILSLRRQGNIRSLSELSNLGIQSSRAAPFILIAGKRPVHQISFDIAAQSPLEGFA